VPYGHRLLFGLRKRFPGDGASGGRAPTPGQAAGGPSARAIEEVAQPAPARNNSSAAFSGAVIGR
jgi:hypothetical protein